MSVVSSFILLASCDCSRLRSVMSRQELKHSTTCPFPSMIGETVSSTSILERSLRTLTVSIDWTRALGTQWLSPRGAARRHEIQQGSTYYFGRCSRTGAGPLHSTAQNGALGVQLQSASREHSTMALEAIVECSRDALWSWTPDGTIVRWNAEAQRLFGYSAREIIGRSLLDLVPPERLAKAQEAIATVSQGHGFDQYETVRVRKDRSRIDVELTVSPIIDGNGQVVECLSSCRADITDRKRLQSQLAGRMNELTTLIRFTEQLQAADKVEDIYRAALDAICAALGCDRASILLFDSAKKQRRFAAWRGLSDNYRTAVDGHCPWTADCDNLELICINDIDLSDQPTSLKAVITAENIRALAFIPLVSKGKLIGKFMTYYRRTAACLLGRRSQTC